MAWVNFEMIWGLFSLGLLATALVGFFVSGCIVGAVVTLRVTTRQTKTTPALKTTPLEVNRND